MKGLKICFSTAELAERYAKGFRYAHRSAEITVKDNSLTLTYPDDLPEDIWDLEGIARPAEERGFKVERLR